MHCVLTIRFQFTLDWKTAWKLHQSVTTVTLGYRLFPLLVCGTTDLWLEKRTRKENDPMPTIDVIPASNADKLFILSHGLFRIYEIAQNELFYNRLTKFLICLRYFYTA